MAKRKIVWSNKARKKLFEILQFYSDRNQSKAYSQKLFNKINQELKLVSIYPTIGLKTDMELVRGVVVENYIFFYEFNTSKVIIHTIWDCRQDPEMLKII